MAQIGTTGRWVVAQGYWWLVLAQCEPGEATAAEQDAVDGEGCQGAGFEVSGEESDGEVSGDECGQASWNARSALCWPTARPRSTGRPSERALPLRQGTGG